MSEDLRKDFDQAVADLRRRIDDAKQLESGGVNVTGCAMDVIIRVA